MIVSLLAALDERGGIGYQGSIPWRLSADLRHFKTLTMGHHLVMGRKTFVSIGRSLPGRITIIVTRNHIFHPQGCLVVHSLEAGLDLARDRGENEVFVIGGGDIFSQALEYADRMYLTLVHTVAQADTFFPAFREEDWIEIQSESHPADAENPVPFTIKTLERRGGRQHEA